MQNYRLEGLFKNRKVGTDEVANPTAKQEETRSLLTYTECKSQDAGNHHRCQRTTQKLNSLNAGLLLGSKMVRRYNQGTRKSR